MRYRALSPTGDYQCGRSGLFLVDSPRAVEQAIKTRLSLWTGEWFLDLEEGTPYNELILGYGKQDVRDQVIKERVLDTEGVLEITAYQSATTADRKMAVAIFVNTQYGPASVATEGA